MPKSDEKWMELALQLAQTRGRYASPNPKVGAVLVKNGRLIGKGGHSRYGGPHAESLALREAGSRAKESTLYVNLEPCSHFGKTPPCVGRIIRSGIKRVVAAMQDPFSLVKGKGFKLLRRAGIQVRVGLLAGRAHKINEPFFSSIKRKRPKVILKAAISLDGKIATSSGKSKWITGEKARCKAHELRAQSDAILVGIGTALQDNPSLTPRLPGFHRRDGWPLRVVLDGRLRLPIRSNLLKGAAKTVVFTSTTSSIPAQRRLEKAGALVFRVPSRKKMLSLKAVLMVLHSLNVRTLLVEGGSRVHASWIEEGLADEAVLFLSNKILGGTGPSWVGIGGVENPNQALKLMDISFEKVGEDFQLTGKFKKL